MRIRDACTVRPDLREMKRLCTAQDVKPGCEKRSVRMSNAAVA